MRRNLAAMGEKDYDLVVVGGGITGVCVARDASLRGLSVALVDKGDFAGATSAASSKLIHGGLRYLQNFEISLVRESLRERRIWSNVAPHLVDPLTFLTPMSKEKRLRGRLKFALGLRAYDWLAYDRNRLDDPDKLIPAHKYLSREEVLAQEPGLASEDLGGAMVFYDYQMYSPERLALDCAFSAAEHGADVANYAEVVGFLREGDQITGVRVRDVTPHLVEERKPSEEAPPEIAIRGRVVVNAAGPWADILMRRMHIEDDGPRTRRRLIRSKGIHLITRSLTRNHAIAVLGKGAHFFILPWRGHSLLGTTDTIYEGDPDKVAVSEKDIVDFLAAVNHGYPSAKLRRSDVLFFYCGLRPLVDTSTREAEKEPAREAKPNAQERALAEEDEDGGEDEPESYSSSRASEVFDHEAEEKLKGVITAIGGKWTTSRGLAEQVVDLAMKKLGKPETPSLTATTPTFGGGVGRFSDFRQEALARLSGAPDEGETAPVHPRLDAAVVDNLARNYGSHMTDVLSLIDEDPALSERLSPRYPDIAAEVVHAVRNEMALTLDDVLFRRTGLGTLGQPGGSVIEKSARIMAHELGWSDEERVAQINRAVARFTSWARSLAVVNPHSWGDKTGSVWPDMEARLEHAIGPVESVFTDAPMSATRLTGNALRSGKEQIIAVGGDGTVNEVVNGFFENGRPINPEAILAVLTSGTGGDFRRTIGLPLALDEQIERLASSEIRSIDLGKVTFIDADGKEAVRYFDNVASFGLSGATDRAVNSLTWAKKLGGKLAFQWGMIKGLFGYRNQRVRIQIDDAYDQVVNVTVAAICNGQYFGGGMRIAPKAKPDDGMFDVIILNDVGVLSLLKELGSVYRGEHLANIHVMALRGRKITATPVDDDAEVLLDIDGEAPGRLPATFEILPNAVYLRS